MLQDFGVGRCARLSERAAHAVLKEWPESLGGSDASRAECPVAKAVGFLITTGADALTAINILASSRSRVLHVCSSAPVVIQNPTAHGAADGQSRNPAISNTSAIAHDEAARVLANLDNRIQAAIGVTSSPRAGQCEALYCREERHLSQRKDISAQAQRSQHVGQRPDILENALEIRGSGIMVPELVDTRGWRDS
eukprot:SM000103S09474  [mRNA]  locus=s103:187578:188651:+ [translate_table: standard]